MKYEFCTIVQTYCIALVAAHRTTPMIAAGIQAEAFQVDEACLDRPTLWAKAVEFCDARLVEYDRQDWPRTIYEGTSDQPKWIKFEPMPAASMEAK